MVEARGGTEFVILLGVLVFVLIVISGVFVLYGLLELGEAACFGGEGEVGEFGPLGHVAHGVDELVVLDEEGDEAFQEELIGLLGV